MRLYQCWHPSRTRCQVLSCSCPFKPIIRLLCNLCVVLYSDGSCMMLVLLLVLFCFF